MSLKNFDIDTFLQEYWQQKPLLVRSAFTNPYFIDANELAGLACEEGIESRIIQKVGQPANERWELKQGPFAESLFTQLPEEDWTLLVQAVDHWVPEVADILQAFHFLPQWRLDDVMVSYAPKGGTVAPHYDFYDVFLIQGEGRRRWQVGQVCDSNSPLVADTSVKILRDFTPLLDVTLEPGDMLYVPAKHAHYGVSIESSLTYSVGFRAPSIRDIVDGVASKALESLSEDVRYEDSLLSLTATRGEVSRVAVEKVHTLLKTVVDDKALLADWLAEFVTEPKYMDATILATDELNFVDILETQQCLYKHPASRFAYVNLGDGYANLYINGLNYMMPITEAQLIAEQAILTTEMLHNLCKQSSVHALLDDLFKQGVLLL